MIGRRHWLGSALAGAGLWTLGSGPARAGGQIEEPLIDSVRTALSSAVANSAPPIPEFTDLEARLAYLRWLGSMSARLTRRKPNWLERKEFADALEAARVYLARIDRALAEGRGA